MTGCCYIHAVLHGHFYFSFNFRVNLRLISSIGLLSSSCIILYYMVDGQLLFKPGLLPHTEHGEGCILQQNVGVHSVSISQQTAIIPLSHINKFFCWLTLTSFCQGGIALLYSLLMNVSLQKFILQPKCASVFLCIMLQLSTSPRSVSFNSQSCTMPPAFL